MAKKFPKISFFEALIDVKSQKLLLYRANWLLSAALFSQFCPPYNKHILATLFQLGPFSTPFLSIKASF